MYYFATAYDAFHFHMQVEAQIDEDITIGVWGEANVEGTSSVEAALESLDLVVVPGRPRPLARHVLRRGPPTGF